MKEHVVGKSKTINSNDRFVRLDKGIATDVVGWARWKNGVPQSVTLPKYMNIDARFMQTFIIKYAGKTYNLTTKFEHENRAVNGKATNTVIYIVP